MPSFDYHSLGDSKTVVPGLVHCEQIQPRIHNDGQSINKLPVELLSRIFTTSELLDRNARPRMVYYIGFQEVITQVCHRWREVAIRCPTLWTYIHITRPSSYRLVSLYLDRAGPSSLLDIDIEMRTRFWKVVAIEPRDWETQLHKVPYVLKFLVSRGATVDRWRSLTVCAKQPEVLYAVIGFINAKPARALQFISFEWKHARQSSELEINEELRSSLYPHLLSESYSFSPSTIPNLRSVEFKCVPWDYIFGTPNPQRWTGLKSLTLTSAYIPCLADDLQKLLASNPELEYLSLGISKEGSNDFFGDIDPEPTIYRVRLSHLHSLSFSTSGHTGWVASMLPVIEAPELRFLSIAGDFELLLASLNLVRHVVSGKSPFRGDSPNNTPSSQAIKTVYPLLDEIDISKLTMVTELLQRMLSSLPTITKLHISNWHIKQLKPVPRILPKLTQLYCSRGSYGQLGSLLRGRADAGFPIETVHLNRIGLRGARELLPKNVKYIEYQRDFGHELDYDDSDLDSNDGSRDDEDTSESSGDDKFMLMRDDEPSYRRSDEDD